MTAIVERARSAALVVASGAAGGAMIVLGAMTGSPYFGLIAVTGLGVVAAVFAMPAAGLLLTAFVVPIERFGRLTSDVQVPIGSLMRVVGAIALASLLLHMSIRRLRPLLATPLLLYASYVALSGLSLLWAVNPPATFAQTATAVGNLMFLFLIVNGVRDWRMVQAMAATWLVATAFIGLYQVYDWHLGAAEEAFESEGVISNRFSTTWDSSSELESVGVVRRALGPTTNAAVYGINLIMTIPFFLYFARFAGVPALRHLAAAGLLLTLYNMLLTNTRAVMLFGAIALAWCALVGLLRVTFGRLMLIAALGAVVLSVAPESVWRRVLDVSNYTVEKASNLRMRFQVWDAALRIGREHWLTGIGVGDRTLLPRYADVPADLISPHNEFLLVFMELGVFGFALFMTFLVVSVGLVWTTAARSRAESAAPEHRAFLLAALITIVVGILFGVQVDVFHFSLKGWWLCLGLACVLRHLMLSRTIGAAADPIPAGAMTGLARVVPS